MLEEHGTAVAVFTGGSLLIGTVGRPDLVEPRLTEDLARAQHASAHRLAAELPDDTAVLPTHGFGSFCSSGRAEGGSTTIGEEKTRNEALVRDVDSFVTALLAGLDDVPAYYAHMGPANTAGPAPVDLTPPAVADAEEIAARLAAGEWVVDLRNRVAFAEGHMAGSLNFEAEGQLATYLAWLIPWGKPVTLLAESAGQLAAAQRGAGPGRHRPAGRRGHRRTGALGPQGREPRLLPAGDVRGPRGASEGRRGRPGRPPGRRTGDGVRGGFGPPPPPHPAPPSSRGPRGTGLGALRRRHARRHRRLPAGRRGP